MIITINSDSLTNVVSNNGVGDRTYYIEKFNELREKRNVKIRYAFHAKTLNGEPYFPIYPIFDFGSNDNTRDQSLYRGGISAIAKPHFTPRFIREVFSISREYGADLVYYYPFSNGTHLLTPTPSPNLVPNNVSFQYGTGPFPGVSAIDITALGGYFELPRKLQVSSLEQNWGFSIFLNNNSSNFRILRIRRQDGRNLDANETPRFAVTMTTSGQIRIIAVDRFDNWIIDWLSTTSIPLGQWGHLALSFSETGHKVYINGVEDTGNYTRGSQNTDFNFSDLLPFDINRFRLGDSSQGSFAQVTWYSDTVTPAEAAQMQVNTFNYTTSPKTAFHFPLNNSLEPSAGYKLIDFTNGNLTYSSSVSKLDDGNGSLLVNSGGISTFPGNIAPFRGLNDYSISFWFKSDSFPQVVYRLNLGQFTLVLNASGIVVMLLRDENNNNMARAHTVPTTHIDEWTHVVMCLSTTQGNRLFVNGQQQTYTIGDETVNYISSDFVDLSSTNLMAQNTGGSGTHFSDYAVWNKFLSQEDAEAMYEGNFDYKIDYSIPTGTTEILGGQVSHRTPIYKTPIIAPYGVDNNLRVRLGSNQPENVEKIRNYLLTLYIED